MTAKHLHRTGVTREAYCNQIGDRDEKEGEGVIDEKVRRIVTAHN
jgi:hypothetical protein